MRTAFAPALLGAALLAAPAASQQDITTVCQAAFAGAEQGALRDRCSAVAQAVDAAQPQLGILLAGGNPTLGTASTGGVRLGFLPSVSATVRLNVVGARLPDIRELDAGAAAAELGEFALPAPAVGANLAVGVFPGVSLAPMLGGFGAVDLLAGGTVLPLSLAGDGFTDAFSWGAGARVGLLRESFVTPGVSVSVMYRELGEVSFGEACTGAETGEGGGRYLCVGGGDFGELSFGLANWSTRAAVSKRLLGIGLTAGLGYDTFSTDADFAFREPSAAEATAHLRRFGNVAVDNSRWSAFVDGSFTVLLLSVVGEVGWMQGADAIAGFPSASDFDPGSGTFFGSIGTRVSF